MLFLKSLIHDVVYFFFSNWNLNLFTWAADRIKWLTHCSAIVLPEKRLMQVSEELFLNVKQHLQTRSKQHFNTTIIIIVVPGCCDVISLPGDHCLFPHRWFSPPHYCCLSSQFARPQMWTDAARGKIKHVINMCQRAGQMRSIDPPEFQRNWHLPGPDSVHPDGSWNPQRGRKVPEGGAHLRSYRETGLSGKIQMNVILTN